MPDFADLAPALAAVLDVVPQPLLLVDGRAMVRHTNRAAEGLLSRGEIQRTRDRRLAAGAATAALHRAIVAIANGRAAQSVVVDRMLLWRVECPGGALVAVFVGGGVPTNAIDARLLCRLYGLTAAEARVAALVATGHSLDEIVAQLRVGRSTARTHIQRALVKTGTTRQAALAHLLLSGPASVLIGEARCG